MSSAVLRRAQPGFTLIEIIVAITIVAIMMGGAFSLFRYIEVSRRTRTEASLKGIQLAVNSFQADTGFWPTMLLDLAVKPADATIARRWRGPYAEERELSEDGWKYAFQYQLNPKGAQHPYELYSWGPHGEGSPQEEWISVWE